MRKVIPVVVSVAVGAAPAIAAPPVAASVVDGQAITIGKTVVARPFGAVLVDGLTLVSTYRVRGHRVHLVRGNAGGACPARYVFVTEQSGGPVMSNVFGTCSGDARVYPSSGALVVAMPDPVRGGATVRYTFDGRAVTALDYPATAAAGQPACIPGARVDAATQGQTVAAIAQGYPADFRGVGRIGRAEIEPDEMRSLVTMLACVSAWPTGRYSIPRLATPLFASRRHGPAAFASLAAITQDATSNAYLRATTRTFAAEMAFRVARREPL